MGLRGKKSVLRNLSKMSRKGSNKRKAVAPVLATLLMIAVAVAMSVIIFMWSQGFLSQTSESTGSQQGSQNQAAQSSISIEVATFKLNTTSPGSTNAAHENITMIVRNVGAVAVSLGSVTITGINSNAGFKGSVQASVSGTSLGAVTASDGSAWAKAGTSTSLASIAKGTSVTVSLGSGASRGTTDLTSGDAITIKVTTGVGTFAQATYTVP